MKQRKWQVLTLSVLMMITMLAAPITAAPGQGVEKTDYLVGFHGSPNRGLVERFGGEVYAEFDYVKAIAVRLPVKAAEALGKNPMIAYVEPDAEVFALAQTVPWGIDRVFGEEAYSFDTWTASRGEGIGVAVLDTGIDKNHQDLADNVIGGYNFIDNKEDYSDGHGHGTHVAGTIAALDNDLGVVGVAPNVNLYGVKVLSDSGSGSTSGIIKGIEWVITNRKHIQIINMSLGSSTYSATFEEACNKAFGVGILVVSSAGNSGNPAGRGDNVGYPAKYASVIAVAASDGNDKRASFSSTGPDVELIAPGVSVLSTVPGNSYASYSGTSMASPHVAGVAALVWAANTNLTNADVRAILNANTEDLKLPTNHQGNGLVRADLAVAATGGGTGPTKFTIKATAGEGGGISPHGDVMVTEGADQTFIITSGIGYNISDVIVDGESMGSIGSYTFTNVQKDHTIAATFVKKTYTLTYTAGTGGTLDGDASKTVDVNHGEDGPLVTATPDNNYVFVNWSDGSTSNPRTDSNVTENLTLTAFFMLVEEPLNPPDDPILAGVTIVEPTNGTIYKYNAWVNIMVKTTDQNDQPVANAAVTVTVENPNGSIVGTYTGSTGMDGIFNASYRVPNKSPIGDYAISATAFKEGIEQVDSVIFKVIGR